MMSQFKCTFVLILFLNLFAQVLMHCYHMNLLSFHTTDTPDYRFEMYLHKNNTISSISTVAKEIPMPMWNLILIQHNKDARRKGSKVEAQKILYNSTYKVCELWRTVKRIRVFNNVADMLFNKDGMGNMSLECPLAVGTYVMQNIHVPPNTTMLKIMYWPNTMYTLYGNVYSLEKNKKMFLKCTYEINATIIKSC